jgi:nucleoside-diphosphate-sugar epimerase
LIAVVGADGFVGAGLADNLNAVRIVYRLGRCDEIQITRAGEFLNRADVVINAAGFRVRPGYSYEDYHRSHLGAISALLPSLREGALLIHISSASVLGRSKDRPLGNETPPYPTSFPSPAYALAKLEADQFLEKAAIERGLDVVFIRPAVIYSIQGAGMLDSLIRLAKQGIILRLYPRNARHHLCYKDLLVDVVRRVIDHRKNIPNLTHFVVADPYTVTNERLESLIRAQLRRTSVTVPIPIPLVSRFLRNTFHSRKPRLDLKTWGEVFGILNLDTTYDPFITFRLLEIDPSRYSPSQTLETVIREAFRQ